MGNSCCRNESPCGSAEERSVLLKNDSKATVPAGGASEEGTCGPDGDDDMRKTHEEADIKVEEKSELVLVKQSPENGKTEPNNTQENGPLKTEIIQTATPSTICKGVELEKNSTRAQDEVVKEPSDDGEQAEPLESTLDSEQKVNPAADWEVFTETNAEPEEETPASVQDEAPDGILLTAQSVSAEKPPAPPETTSNTEHLTELTSHQDEGEAGSRVMFDEAVNEPSGELSANSEVSVPNTEPAAGQVMPVSVVSEEADGEAPSCAVTEDSEDSGSSVLEQVGPEAIESHDVSESSLGSGRDHSGEERDSVNSLGESETAAPAEASKSSKADQSVQPDSECSDTNLKDVSSLEKDKQDTVEETKLEEQDKDENVAKMKDDEAKEEEKEEKEVEENAPSETQVAKDSEMQEVTVKEEQLAGSTATDVQVEVETIPEKEESDEAHLQDSEEDLYRAAEELPESQHDEPGPTSVFETTIVKVEDRCSLAPAVDILSYSEREWKGNTAKSVLIRKGYKEMSQRFSSLRRVRGDNYCALRATLFQVLSHSTQLPAWLQEDDATMLPEHLETQEGLISQWTFPDLCLRGDGTGDVTQQLKSYMELLRNKWQAAVDCSSDAERHQLCERVFQGGEEELGLLEALKLLMLGRAVELHGCMQAGGDVPLFCWLLFARDSSDCPRSFLCNHLSHVGLGAGLEQVEMFLLGYALHCTLQVYRLYKADTEEFVTYYPDDHKDDWPSVCLVTEDDRHYNVPVMEAAELHEELDSS
ncbi:glutamic acid-rich protein [Limanda limanda]|uniref:glutamic acid-rich protein n=1 Tax=Limanda limanda TaxID=27771 RepID=UPI0029C96A5F|nr:glutamic acid-rich protein [Limanda limanda]XP_060949500.1 glutamic acid-rich protein [Limanda limanda]XP_060949501.1 glutamic acid-rich protein [Limanda limanda]